MTENFMAILKRCNRCGEKYMISYQNSECPHESSFKFNKKWVELQKNKRNINKILNANYKSMTKFQVGDKVKCSLRCPKCVAFEGIDKVVYIEYDSYNKCSWYYLKKHNTEDIFYRSYELEEA